MAKKILIVDDSALMRRMLCDIIMSDARFEVEDTAENGAIAIDFIREKKYDIVLLDMMMPKLTGIEVLRQMQKENIRTKVIVISSTNVAAITMEALELGAIDFLHKPASIMGADSEKFRTQVIGILITTCFPMKPVPIKIPVLTEFVASTQKTKKTKSDDTKTESVFKQIGNQKIVALACSTGGPKALQSVVPLLPSNLDAPVVIVQHMPKGFTKSLADRLNQISEIEVVEAEAGDVLKNGCVYIAKGGCHLKLAKRSGKTQIVYSDEPPREGVKPCANYLFESITDTNYEQVLCVVLTGMGCDGTQGIVNLLNEKGKKEVRVIAQDEKSCIVYGMPRAIVDAKVVDKVVELELIAKEIIKSVGVQ